MLQNLSTAVRELQHAFSDAFNPYRPEFYYMRGPGPACRAKAALATGKNVVLLVSALFPPLNFDPESFAESIAAVVKKLRR
jgi:hypothetical protein